MPNVGKYDLIILFEWWHDEHHLKNVAGPQKWIFDEAKCHSQRQDEAGADLFEVDETVAYDREV